MSKAVMMVEPLSLVNHSISELGKRVSGACMFECVAADCVCGGYVFVNACVLRAGCKGCAACPVFTAG